MFYAVGFGSWYQNGPGYCMDGQNAKVAGPFQKAKQAWQAANKLQEGASMMCDWPFVFKSNVNMSLKSLAHKIDYDEYEVQDTYAGKDSIHIIRFTREYQKELETVGYHHQCPSSMPVRRRYLTMIRRAVANHTSFPKNPLKRTKKLLRDKRKEAEAKRFQERMRRERWYSTGKAKIMFEAVESCL